MVHGDDNGLVLPPFVAPTQVVIIPIMQQKPGVLEACQGVYESLKKAGIRVKIDLSSNSPGWKFAEYEMKGIPLRVEIGPRDLEQGQCVVAQRNTKEKHTFAITDLVNKIPSLFKTMHQQMMIKAKQHLDDHISEAHSLDELISILNTKGGYIKASVCDDADVELIVKEKAQATARVIPFNQLGLSSKCIITGKKATRIVYFARAY
jgi:prolyl-tRNA synthetase